MSLRNFLPVGIRKDGVGVVAENPENIARTNAGLLGLLVSGPFDDENLSRLRPLDLPISLNLRQNGIDQRSGPALKLRQMIGDKREACRLAHPAQVNAEYSPPGCVNIF